LAPDGRTLAFTLKEHPHSPYTQVGTINIANREVRYLTSGEKVEFALQWISDGTIVYKEEIIISAEADAYLCAMRGEGSEPRRILHYSRYRGVNFETDSFHSPVVSPDGTKIAMISWGGHKLYISHGGAAPTPVENDGLKIQRIAWAPDSSRLAFAATRGRAQLQERLYVIRDDGTGLKALRRVLVESEFAWSPDNLHIAAIGLHTRTAMIKIIHAHTSEARAIATVETDPGCGDPSDRPVWSSDGSSILCTTFVDPRAHLYRADVAEGRVSLLVGDEGEIGSISQLAWHRPSSG
jgi:Tol biopolymer transport system component